MPADPISAGRKGGQARSAKKLAAARRNGFQKAAPAQEQPADLQPGCSCMGQRPECAVTQPKEGN
jgi:hypothetical protein